MPPRLPRLPIGVALTSSTRSVTGHRIEAATRQGALEECLIQREISAYQRQNTMAQRCVRPGQTYVGKQGFTNGAGARGSCCIHPAAIRMASCCCRSLMLNWRKEWPLLRNKQRPQMPRAPFAQRSLIFIKETKRSVMVDDPTAQSRRRRCPIHDH